MHIGRRIRFLREQAGITQGELAKIIGVSRMSVTHWETERAEPFYEAVIKMADYFKVTTDYILGRDNPPPTPADTVVTFTDGRQVPFSKLTPEERAAIESVWRLVSARLAKEEQGKGR